VAPDASADDQDTLVQVGAVAQALKRLGWRVTAVPITLDLAGMTRRLKQIDPHVVFNLVESIGGVGQHIHLPPTVLETMGLPFTGCASPAMFQTSNKLLTKRRMIDTGIPTSAWIEPDGQVGGAPRGRFIVKSAWEDASIGLDASAVVDGIAAARRRIAEMTARYGGLWFAESFIDGREFAVALLEDPDRPRDPLPLPAAEMKFIDFPPDMPRILDYASKWDKESFAYRNTPHELDLPESDRPLIEQLVELSVRCWRLFELKGYARVDFRVDRAGRPYVLEVNPNPCLSPDAGFAAMLERAGIDFDVCIDRIIAACLGSNAVSARRRTG
jgi:D-alanine-D-alanine ligase